MKKNGKNPELGTTTSTIIWTPTKKNISRSTSNPYIKQFSIKIFDLHTYNYRKEESTYNQHKQNRKIFKLPTYYYDKQESAYDQHGQNCTIFNLLTTTEKENIPAASKYRITRYSVYLPTKKNLPTTGQSDYNFNPNGQKSFREFW